MHDGNVTTCQQAGLPGTTIQPAQVKHSITENTYIDITDTARASRRSS